MSNTDSDEQWRPNERPGEPPTHPYDPNESDRPDRTTNPLPMPGDEEKPKPISEPDNPPDPIGDPARGEPRRV